MLLGNILTEEHERLVLVDHECGSAPQVDTSMCL